MTNNLSQNLADDLTDNLTPAITLLESQCLSDLLSVLAPPDDSEGLVALSEHLLRAWPETFDVSNGYMANVSIQEAQQAARTFLTSQPNLPQTTAMLAAALAMRMSAFLLVWQRRFSRGAQPDVTSPIVANNPEFLESAELRALIQAQPLLPPRMDLPVKNGYTTSHRVRVQTIVGTIIWLDVYSLGEEDVRISRAVSLIAKHSGDA